MILFDLESKAINTNSVCTRVRLIPACLKYSKPGVAAQFPRLGAMVPEEGGGTRIPDGGEGLSEVMRTLNFSALFMRKI